MPKARPTSSLPCRPVDHSLAAVYAGDVTHQPSASPVADVQAQVSGTPNFTVSVAPATLTLKAGQTGTVTASVTPQNSSGLTAPMFVTLSCSGLPDQSSCTFTPENLEILPNATAPLTSSMVLVTQAAIFGTSRSPSNQLRRLGFSASRRARPWRTGLGISPPPLAQSPLAAGPGGIGHDAGHHGLQSALLLSKPRPAHQPRHSARHLHRASSPLNPATASPPSPIPPLWH